MGSFELIVHPRSRRPRPPSREDVGLWLSYHVRRAPGASAAVVVTGTRALLSRLVPWLTYSRLGQWVAVLLTALGARYVAINVPSLAWDPLVAFACGFVGTGLVLAVWSRSFFGTPLGDLLELVLGIIDGLIH